MKVKKTNPESHNLNPNEVWTKYEKMIKKIAHRLSKKYEKPYDEVLSEGILEVFSKLKNWNPKRATLCTFIYLEAQGAMLTYCIKPYKEVPIGVYLVDEDENKNHPFLRKKYNPNTWIKKLIAELSEEARVLVNTIIESPEELYHAVKPSRPVRSKTALKNYLIDVMDWDSHKFERIFTEVAKCL